MSMNVSQDGGDEDTPMSDINTTPLVDVMLVLLIVFLITIPVMTAQPPVQLPQTKNIETKTAPENINLSILGDGTMYLGMAKIDGVAQLRDIVLSRAREKPQPEVHIKADREVRYETVGRAVFAIQRGGIAKVGFITDPAGH